MKLSVVVRLEIYACGTMNVLYLLLPTENSVVRPSQLWELRTEGVQSIYLGIEIDARSTLMSCNQVL